MNSTVIVIGIQIDKSSTQPFITFLVLFGLLYYIFLNQPRSVHNIFSRAVLRATGAVVVTIRTLRFQTLEYHCNCYDDLFVPSVDVINVFLFWLSPLLPFDNCCTLKIKLNFFLFRSKSRIFYSYFQTYQRQCFGLLTARPIHENICDLDSEQ